MNGKFLLCTNTPVITQTDAGREMQGRKEKDWDWVIAMSAFLRYPAIMIIVAAFLVITEEESPLGNVACITAVISFFVALVCAVIVEKHQKNQAESLLTKKRNYQEAAVRYERIMDTLRKKNVPERSSEIITV